MPPEAIDETIVKILNLNKYFASLNKYLSLCSLKHIDLVDRKGWYDNTFLRVLAEGPDKKHNVIILSSKNKFDHYNYPDADYIKANAETGVLSLFIQIEGNHWIGGIFHRDSKQILCYDPLYGDKKTHVLKSILEKQLLPLLQTIDPEINEIKIIINKKTIQENGYDCGAYAAETVDLLSKNTSKKTISNILKSGSTNSLCTRLLNGKSSEESGLALREKHKDILLELCQKANQELPEGLQLKKEGMIDRSVLQDYPSLLQQPVDNKIQPNIFKNILATIINSLTSQKEAKTYASLLFLTLSMAGCWYLTTITAFLVGAITGAITCTAIMTYKLVNLIKKNHEDTQESSKTVPNPKPIKSNTLRRTNIPPCQLHPPNNPANTTPQQALFSKAG